VFKKVEVTNFGREERSDLLFRYLERSLDEINEDETEVACQISDILGGLPLAIATMGGYMNESECPLDAFLTNIKKSSNAWEAGAVGPVQQYEKTLETVFQIALGELPPSTQDFINILAFLNHDSIPEELFLTQSGDPSLPFLKKREE
jgi:hypothetical protein